MVYLLYYGPVRSTTIILLSLLQLSTVNAKIEYQGTDTEIKILKNWVQEIIKIPHGKKIYNELITGHHTLTIKHDTYARLASGITRVVMSENSSNGIGIDALVLMDTTTPKKGSHYTFDLNNEDLELTPIQSLFHEMVHARDHMYGKWYNWINEEQAIKEENIFRKQQQEITEITPIRLRRDVDGCSYEEDRQECLDFLYED